MLLAVQHTVQLFANLVVASTMGLSLALGVAGSFHQRVPLDCSACRYTPAPAMARAAKLPKVTLASVY